MALGYRTPARSGPEIIDYASLFEDDAEELGLDEPLPSGASAPTVRLANALLINALAKNASMIHVEPPEIARPVRFRIDGQWHDELELAPELMADVVRRLKVMSMLSPHDGGAAVGQLFIQLGMDDRPRQFLVLVRPAQQGVRLLVRVVSDAERRRLMWPQLEGTAEAEEKLRWDREQLFRIAAASMERGMVETSARSFLAAAEALLPGAHRQVMEVRALLAGLAEDAGAMDAAIREIEEAIGMGRSFGAPAMSTSVLVERLADLRQKDQDLEGAIEAREEAVALVERTLDSEDPYLSGVLGRLADTLVAAGRVADAEPAYDEAIRILSELTGDDDLELRSLVSARTRALSAVS